MKERDAMANATRGAQSSHRYFKYSKDYVACYYFDFMANGVINTNPYNLTKERMESVHDLYHMHMR